jgi:glycosyltransferase involved in cell wall biosynthesis
VSLGYDVVDNNHFADGARRARDHDIEARSAHDLPDRYILSVARFIPKKNLVGLVAAFAQAVYLTGSKHYLVIVGDGPCRSDIEHAISTYEMTDRIRLLGVKSYSALPVIYGLADAFAHVSFNDQWGLVVNEAAASGLPLLVSSRCGAVELVKHGVNGYLVDPTNGDEVAQKIAVLLRISEQRRKCMGLESQRVVSEWGPERFGRGLQDAISAASRSQVFKLSTLDTLAFRLLSRRSISHVP